MKYNYVKSGWNRIKSNLDEIKDVYSLNKTKQLLLEDNYYISLFGKAKNRTLIKDNPKLQDN